MKSELQASRSWFLFFAVASILAVAVAIVLIAFAVRHNRMVHESQLHDAVIENFEMNRADREKRYNALQDEIDTIKKALGIGEREPVPETQNTRADWRR